ncbi:hypothetical protein DSO57_1036282 [Entomophthora muscae]|uniref:Uncharacterized protein n=1 Tax=Entomophthora muscae TaxID=34485 RepID=A0ACC2TYB4_9FUNG|nr:hypothetical protein DSO57_1036282 [Entomophthora muscae]
MVENTLPKALVLRYPPDNEDWQEFKGLFRRLTVLKVLRGVGSKQEKQALVELAQYQACFDKLNIGLIAICEESEGCVEFLKTNAWNGDFFVDIYRDVCRPASDTSVNSSVERKKSKLPGAFRKKLPRLRGMFQLGGTYIIKPDKEIVFRHEPKDSSDVVCLGNVLTLCHTLSTASRTEPKPTDDSNQQKAKSRHSWKLSDEDSDEEIETSFSVKSLKGSPLGVFE